MLFTFYLWRRNISINLRSISFLDCHKYNTTAHHVMQWVYYIQYILFCLKLPFSHTKNAFEVQSLAIHCESLPRSWKQLSEPCWGFSEAKNEYFATCSSSLQRNLPPCLYKPVNQQEQNNQGSDVQFHFQTIRCRILGVEAKALGSRLTCDCRSWWFN